MRLKDKNITFKGVQNYKNFYKKEGLNRKNLQGGKFHGSPLCFLNTIFVNINSRDKIILITIIFKYFQKKKKTIIFS